MPQLTNVPCDPDRTMAAFEALNLQDEVENQHFQTELIAYAHDTGHRNFSMPRGYGKSTIRNIRAGKKPKPNEVHPIIAQYLYRETGIDVTIGEMLKAFNELDYQIQVSLKVDSHNDSGAQQTRHDLKNLEFQIHEAHAKVIDLEIDDIELDVRLGFDRVRLSIHGDGLRATDNRLLLGETPRTPDAEPDRTYTGWFNLRLATKHETLSWLLEPKAEGQILEGRVDAEDVACIETYRGAPLMAEVTARTEALCVRLINSDSKKATRKMADLHRDRMSAQVMKRQFQNNADECIIHRMSLTGRN